MFAVMIDIFFFVLMQASQIILEVLWLKSSCSTLCVNILSGNLISMIMSLQIYNLLNRFFLQRSSAAAAAASGNKLKAKANMEHSQVSALALCSLVQPMNFDKR